MARLATRAAWLRRPSVAPPLGRGLRTRAAALAGFPGLRIAGRQPGRWCVPGLGGSGLGAGPPGDDGSAGCTARPAGGGRCRWDASSACAGACRWSPGAAVMDVAGAWGLGLLVGLWAWGCTVPEGRVLVVSVGVVARAYGAGPSGGAYAGPSIGRSGVPWRGRGSGWACVPCCLAGCRLRTVCGRAGYLGLRSRASSGAWGWFRVRVCGARGLLWSVAYCPRIRGAGHGPAPGM